MIRIDDVRARIEARVPALAGKMGNAGQFAQLVERNQMPQHTCAGFVLPGGLQGGTTNAISGLFTQSFVETAIVVLAARVANDPTGERATDELTPLVREVIEAVCGWGPDDAPGIFILSSGELVGTQAGTLVYQIDFQLSDQLRITP
ncbi:hypothetical protein GGQ88_000118 [Novosphingobium hassiacum]|uniref:DUF3168 domain-containing protein n=1 Tax=Novosphingobium hassiacum TaxID=173676 RepID=A0A7W5ZRW7_9SPHN|nr:hypothetical protein [Novosphingobium hassiacum]MBB3858878.1 hypothetical protein [Novosphingobium hassiacum]